MKKIIFIHVFLFLFIPLAFSQTILNVEDFEGTDFVGYAIGNADTGTDYSSQNFIVSGPDRISRGTVGSFTFDGSITGNATNFIGGEDINFTTDGGFYNGHSYIELDPIDITSKSNLSIDIDVAFPNTSPTRYEINDFFIVDYKIDGGSYTTVLAFYGDGDTPTPTLGLRRDDNLNGILDIGEVSIVNTAMTSFNLNLDAITGSAVSGNSIEIRVRFKMPDSQEEFAFDNIILKGSIGNTAPVIGGISIGQLVDDNSTIAPFSAITTTDADGDNLSATITLDDNLKGTLTGTGLSGSGPYTIASTTPADLQSKLRALTFNPTDNRTTTIETTTFSVVINDGTDTDTNNTTTVISNAVAPTVTSVDVPANATYLVGQDLDFTINFSENVTVNTTVGTPQIAITIGATVRQATYVSGSGTNALVYRYTIQLGDLDINGITVGILVANGGTLRDSGGEDAILTLLNIGLTTAVLVDANIPILTSVNVPANATYITGQNLDFTVNFNDNIIVNTSVGTPQLAIIIGATTRQATYISGSGTNALVFRYTVQTGDLDTNGIAVIALSANGGTLKNAGNNDANLTLIGVGLTGGVLVDAVAPIVTSVTVPANATYITGQNLDFTVNLSKNTIVNTTLGTPQLAITVGATTRQASYISGSGTSSLLFRYTVQAGDLDTDGIAVGTLSANGGTLLDLVNNVVDLTLNSVGTTVGILVDAIAPIVTSVTVPANATYITGQNLDFTVNLSENTIVNTTLGTPQLAITVGATTRQASYISGSGTTALLFRYTVQAGDLDTDGIAVGTLSANGGTLLDLVNNVVDLTLNSVGTTVGVLVDAIAPIVTSVTVPANATYITGQNLDFTVNLSENTIVNTTLGTPQLAITVGATTRQASYISGSGTTALLFRYTVQAGDLDTDGIAVGTLSANGGTLLDLVNNIVDLTLNSVGTTVGVLVDAIAPIVTSVTVPTNATYITGQNLDFTVNLSKNTIVNTTLGTPQLAITVGATTRQASYISGSGTSSLLFRYTVQAGDLDTDGIAVGTLSANGGTLLDLVNNIVDLTLNSVGTTVGVLVDAIAPIVTSVTVPANATYITGQNLDFTVNLSENTIVNTTLGTPQLAITVGATTRQASYISGSGTTALLFRYTVQAGDLDTDGIAVGTLSVNGGTLLDLVNNIVDLTLNSVGTTVGVLVDAIAPIVTSVTVPANATYITGQNLDFTVNLSENTIVNTTLGTPQLAITVGATTRQASYISGSGTSSLLFSYTVQAGDLDTDGIAVGTLSANGGTLLDLVNNIVDLTLNSVGTTVGVLVDAIAPIVTSVTVPANATYITGQNLDFTVNLSENTIVNTSLGTPQLAITVGATTRQASYISGSGTTALLFRYTIQTGELDSDGITIASLSANGGTLQDNATNDLNTVLNNVGSTSSILVDALAPTGYSVDLDYNPINDTNEDAISFSFSGAEVGSTYNYTINSSGGGTNVTGSGTINMMNDQITGIDLSALSDGTITLSFSLTDAYNNIGNTVTDTAIKGTDSDNDGIADSLDNCPSTSNTDQIDTDNDGKGDMCDTDDDNDGTLDSEDAFPLDNTENTDTDGDGTGDNADTDDDNDGTLDSEDAFPLDNTEDTDTDGDGTGDNADTDDDNDGTLDSEDAFPLDNTEDTDTDGDGTGDNADTDDDNDGTLDSEDAFPLDNTEDTDTDGDGTGDNADTDDDNDGTLDSEDAFPLDNTEDTDTDGDGTGDNADTDDDNDGTLDSEDAFPLDNAEDTDTDGDGTGDNADTDDDNDGTLDSEDAFPLDPTEDKDSDNDGIGDNSDTDSDSDIKEGNPEPAQAFTPNGDGINDTWLIPGINKYPNNLVKV